MQVSTATCLAGGMGRSPFSNPSANRSFASSSSLSTGILGASLAYVALRTCVPTGRPRVACQGKQKGPPWRPLPSVDGCPYDRTATSRSPGERTGSNSRGERGSWPQPTLGIGCAPIPTHSVDFGHF
jgi:hypothetical protein